MYAIELGAAGLLPGGGRDCTGHGTVLSVNLMESPRQNAERNR